MKTDNHQISEKFDTKNYRVAKRFTILQVMVTVGILGVVATVLLQRFF